MEGRFLLFGFFLIFLETILVDETTVRALIISRHLCFKDFISYGRGSRLTKLMSTPSRCSNNKSSSRENNKKAALYSFTEARKIARGHGYSTKQEFLDYDCPGAYQLPKNPEEVWADDWKGWEDFLGICLSFEEGRKVARELENVDSEESYLNLFREKKLNDDDIASRLPYRPDLKYKDQWISWDDFLLG